MQTRNSNAYLSQEVGAPPSSGLDFNISDIVGILRRGWFLPFLGCLIGLGLALTYVSFTPELYKSSARILIDRSVNRYLQTNKVVDEPFFDDAEIGSQIYVLSSESIVVPVVRSMNLTKDPEFAGSPKNADTDGAWGIQALKNLVKKMVGWQSDVVTDPELALERVAIELFLRCLDVHREDVASVINVTFASENPKKAADITNALVENYLTSTLEARFNSTRVVSQMLQDRLGELKQQAADADRALQEYKIANNLVSTGKGLLTSEQMAGLSTQLTAARIAVAEAKARLDRVQQPSAQASTASLVPDNSIIQKLRLEYLEVSARTTAMENHVGPKHQAVTKHRKRMEELAAVIRDEEQRIANSYSSDYHFAQARNNELADAMSQIMVEAGTTNQAQVTMRELESSAETLRNLYNSFLQKFSELSKANAQPMPMQDARIITRAAPPLRKSAKKTLAVIGGGTMLGLLLGLAAAIAGELAAGGFRTREQVRRATDLDCEVLPNVEPISRILAFLPSRVRRKAARTAPGGLVEHVLDAPYSRFTETFRKIKALTTEAHRTSGNKVIGVVSSVAKEGKSTVLMNLAALMATSSPARILIIDGDLHRRRLSAELAPDAREGLLEVLADPARLSQIVSRRERSKVDFLPCVLAERIPNAAERLGSPQMERLLEAARGSYDVVLIELPPVISVADVKMIKRFVDQFIFVVEWNMTKRRLVLEALAEVEAIRDRIICVVLNRADPAALQSIEAYKGDRFSEYYER